MKFLVATTSRGDKLRIVDPFVIHVYTGSYTMYEVYVDKMYRDTIEAFLIAVRQVMTGVSGLDYTKEFVVFSDTGLIRTFVTPDGYALVEVESERGRVEAPPAREG